MDKPFDVVVVGLLRSVGTIAKAIAKSFTQLRKLRSFFLLGGCRPHNQHQGDGGGAQIDLCDGYLSAEFSYVF